LTTDQDCTINTYYGADGSEEITPQSKAVLAGESVRMLFDKFEDTVRIEIVAGGTDVADLDFALYGYVAV